MLAYVRNQRNTKLRMLNSKEAPHFRDNFTEYKKISLLNLANILQYKVSQTFATLLQ